MTGGEVLSGGRRASGGFRSPLNPRMGRRLAGWDYRKPWIYMVTLTLADRPSRAFGRLGGERVALSPLGEAVWKHFWRWPEFQPEIKPLFIMVMPDHLHFILQVTAAMERPLGNAIAGFKGGCSKLAAAGTAGAGQKKPLFEEGFVDSIIFGRGQLDREFKYLKDNPRRLAVKVANPELFRVAREVEVEWREPDDGQPEAGQQWRKGKGRFSAVGNHFLLERGRLAQVQVSRNASAGEVAERKEELLEEARKGAVLVSPCVSPGERAIARVAMEAGLPLVVLKNKGFAKQWKPPGAYFDACVEGRLLMLAPAAWPWTSGEKKMTRRDAVALNRIAQWLSGEGGAVIDYKGMTPEDIDRLALEAVGRPSREE